MSCKHVFKKQEMSVKQHETHLCRGLQLGGAVATQQESAERVLVVDALNRSVMTTSHTDWLYIAPQGRTFVTCAAHVEVVTCGSALCLLGPAYSFSYLRGPCLCPEGSSSGNHEHLQHSFMAVWAVTVEMRCGCVWATEGPARMTVVEQVIVPAWNLFYCFTFQFVYKWSSGGTLSLSCGGVGRLQLL